MAVDLTPDQVEKYTVRYVFREQQLSLLQTPRERSSSADNTGWCLWEASNILLRWIADERNILYALGRAENEPPPTFGSLRFLDMSCGAGLVALSVASAGARSVAASDILEQLPQLKDNVRRSGFRILRDENTSSESLSREQCATSANPIEIIAHYWGADISALKPASLDPPVPFAEAAITPAAAVVPGAWYDVVLISDIVFIAIRDGRTAELERTIRELAPHCGCLVMSFEERLPDEEQAMMARLGLGSARAPSPAAAAAIDAPSSSSESPVPASCDSQSDSPLPPSLCVEELTGSAVTVDFEHRLEGAGGHADTSLFNPYLFWECPPVRMFVIRAA